MSTLNPDSLLKEGDVNFSAFRKRWYHLQDDATIDQLDADANLFLHQSLSTPCLDVIESAAGIYLINSKGKKYMDFHGNSVHQVGYNNHYILDRVKAQMDTLAFSPRRYTNAAAIQFATKLTSLFPAALDRVLFAPGGTSAVSMALKLARLITGKQKVVSFIDSFHGASLDAIEVGGEEQFKRFMGKDWPNTINISQPGLTENDKNDEQDLIDAQHLEDILNNDDQIGAFIAETIRNTDVRIPSMKYWKKVREICSKYNVLLILDEIPIAFGRTGKMFAFEHFQIEPDIVCLGKGLGAGIIPMAGIVTKSAYNIGNDISLGHFTHEKSPLGSVAGLAMIEYLENEYMLEKVQADEVFVRNELTKLKEKFSIISDIRGIGLLWGIELLTLESNRKKAYKEAEQILYDCLENGLSFKISQGNVLQLCPSLTISREELLTAFLILEKAFTRLN